jgi:hypothetical protein
VRRIVDFWPSVLYVFIPIVRDPDRTIKKLMAEKINNVLQPRTR